MDGWLGTTAGVTDDGRTVAVVRFESEEAARRNSERPEQARWWDETSRHFAGDVAFHDCPRTVRFLDGGSDDAAFVQVIQGRTTDVDRMIESMEQASDALRELRPDVIGGTVALHGDGGFTQVVYFTSETAAREGERKEAPPELKAMDEEAATLFSDTTYFDLRQPWLHSPT